jgi:magnesium transporter
MAGAGLAALALEQQHFLTFCAACLFGVPSILHGLRLDPKIAVGPVTLALADIFTLLFYFSLGAWLL